MTEDDVKKLLKNALFIVEATDFERYTLWCNFSSQSRHRIHSTIGLKWIQTYNATIFIGTLDNRPVELFLTWALIEGQEIVFWTVCSEVSDRRMVKKWLEENFTGRYDDNSRYASTNAMNFQHCIKAIEEATGKCTK